MGLLHFYTLFLLKNPGKVLFGGVSLVLVLFGVTLLIRPVPNFRDPLVGFEARDTLIASRINAWKLLLDESSASANNLSLGPNSSNYEGNFHHATIYKLNNDLNLNDIENRLTEPPLVEMSTQNNKSGTIVDTTLDEDEDEYYRSLNSTIEPQDSLMHYSLGSEKAFCGKLYEGYAQVVIAPVSKQAGASLFNLNSMLSVCQLDRRLRLEHSKEDSQFFQRDCERFQMNSGNEEGKQAGSACCNSWSMPNYIACLNNKTSCHEIDAYDMKNTEHLLNLCAPYYYKAPYEECFNSSPNHVDSVAKSQSPTLNILSSTSPGFDNLLRSYCGTIPEKCLRCDGWTFNVMNYLTNDNFVQNRLDDTTVITPTIRPNSKRSQIRANTILKESLVNKLSYTNIFLPIAKSTTLLKYYHALSRHSLKTAYTQVKAMDLGLKSSLFDYLISDDSKLFVVALVLILTVISLYTWSLVISLVILVIICLSICLSYVAYELLLNIPIFPFMNLLAVVISFGICSDNAMLFCKHWSSERNGQDDTQINNNQKEANKEELNLHRMLRQAIISTSVATSATACSFIISAISKVVAVRCFCVFATLSVITNYLLIVVLLPPALILDSRFSVLANNFLSKLGPKFNNAATKTQYFREKLLKTGKIFHNRWIFDLVTRFKFYLIVTFIALLSCSSILVFHKPALQPADEDDVQLLSRKHTFEQYDKNLRKQFAFERFKTGEYPSFNTANRLYDPPDTLPVRIVFGINPIDNGNHLDPQERGSLIFDPNFDIADPNSQIWLLDFCRKLRFQHKFIHPSSTPDLSNCFMETFKSWMEARSCRDPIQTDLDRSPCCQASEFPYSRQTFYRCVGEAVSIMRKTPQFQPDLQAGLRFFKNTTKVAAMIVEYQSNRLYSGSFRKMERFFTDVDDWVSWQINNTAPLALKSGWFISNNLELLALQTELEQSTTSSILIEVVFAMIALLIGTRDAVLTFAGTLTIGTIIIVTVASLIILRWTLGVAESILISLTIGLSIDFALHYSVAFGERRKVGTNDVTISRILDEVGSPIALATITTSLAGFVIMWSDILAYQELGVFLMLIAFVSWLTSTFFLLPMLATVGTLVNHGEIYARSALRRTLKLLIDRL